jgi:predicted esterase
MIKLRGITKPHFGERTLLAGSEISVAKRVMIMIHGRGADGESMLELAKHFVFPDGAFVIPQAANNTWYPYRFIEDRQMNEPGISSSFALIEALIKYLNERGIKTQDIFLLGFSQGACLCADYCARYPRRYGGVFVLSGGLIGKNVDEKEFEGDLKRTPVFLGCSESDLHIPVERVHQSTALFKILNANITERIYQPEMGHSINRDELDFINKVLSI